MRLRKKFDIRVGSKVSIPWWESDFSLNTKQVPNLKGTIESINGAYHYIKIHNNKKI